MSFHDDATQRPLPLFYVTLCYVLHAMDNLSANVVTEADNDRTLY